MPRRLRLPFIALAVGLLLWVGTGTAAAGMPSYPHQSLGNRGSNVRAIQGFLRQQGIVVRITGIFDAPTVEAVKTFQGANGLPVTGMVDGPTWARFLRTLTRGTSGEIVAVLQRQLNEKRG